MNEWKAYLNRSLALQWPVWIESWTERPRPTNRLAEMSSLESEQAWTLRTSWRFWGRGGMASAEPKRKRSPKNAHQEAAARPKKRRLGSRLYGQTRAHFRGRNPALKMGPLSEPFCPNFQSKGGAIAIQFPGPGKVILRFNVGGMACRFEWPQL